MRSARTTTILIISLAWFLFSGLSLGFAHEIEDYTPVDTIKGRPSLVYGLELGVAVPVSYPDDNLKSGGAVGANADYLFGVKKRWGIWSDLVYQTISCKRWNETISLPNILANGESRVSSSVTSLVIGPEFAIAPLGQDRQRVIFRAGLGIAWFRSAHKFRVSGFDSYERLTLSEMDNRQLCYQFSINVELGERLSTPWELSVQYFATSEAEYMVRDGFVSGGFQTVRVMLVGSVWGKKSLFGLN